MAFNSSGTNRNDSDDERGVIGFFRYASDARRALHALHQQQFTSDQVVAAYRAALPQDSPQSGDTELRNSGKWFGQLRQIYRGDERGHAHEELAGNRDASSMGFEAMAKEIDLSSSDTSALDQDLDRGGALVMVRAGHRNQDARVLLETLGARLLPVRPAGSLQSVSPASAVSVSSIPFHSPEDPTPDHIQLFGEVLRVRKEKVSSGDVRVSKEATTHMETVQVPVTREHLLIRHTDGNDSQDVGQTLRIPLSEERVHIDKDTVLREEYKVGKREVIQNEALTDVVRRERLLIDDGNEQKRS